MYRTTLSFLLAAGLTVPTSVSPCGFHNYAPQPTLVDRLLGSDQIVLARSAPNNPFRFEAYEALEGGLNFSEIPLLVDSTTRRRFALDTNAAVLFARDGAYGPWQRLAYVDAAMAPVVRTVMARLPSWELGEGTDRFRYFTTLVGHPEDRIHKLALRELDLADYSLLRSLDLRIDTPRLVARLNHLNENEFKAIRILLLGLSDDIQLRDRLAKGVQYNVRSGGTYLGAYATALIELVGPDAVTNLAARYLTNREIPLQTRELLIEAIALHGGTDDQDMEASISQAINSALWIDPRLAAAAARQFGARGNWSLQDAVQALLEEGTVLGVANKQDVSHYVVLANEALEKP
ncbi:hypothetical protein KL867_20940 [Ruegeria litorea]|uniref:Uncharacterized protein n=1 Tax=Falsiruegeria litorea TaxID=1280831 RepID=A0ABS5WWL3_9RHOB|nr:hypothetical protein [Falsiruegeria litorea]MBT3143527.1 hypothetical protein [Falsiruegeria litorea]